MEWEKTPDLVNNDFIYFLYIIYINKYKMLIIVICTIVLFFFNDIYSLFSKHNKNN